MMSDNHPSNGHVKEVKIFFVSVLIITGGQDDAESLSTVEVFVPSTNKTCSLPSLPVKTIHHSQDQLTQCGGAESPKTCYTFTNGTWLETATLINERISHRSWSSPDGIVLIGGHRQERTTEKISHSGLSTRGFYLIDDVK